MPGKIVQPCASLVLSLTLVPLLGHADSIELIEPEILRECGQVVVQPQEGCQNISGMYELIGKVVPEPPGFTRTLSHILAAAVPNAAYQPNVEKYAALEVVQDKKLKVTVVLGEASRITIMDVSCERGWLRLERAGETGSEGNTVRFYTTTTLARCVNGGLVAQYMEDIKSTTLFGLLRSKHTELYWLHFPLHMVQQGRRMR